MGKRTKNFAFAFIILSIVLAVYFITNSSELNQDELVLLSATGVDYSGNDIETSYSGGEKIRGPVNLSLTDVVGGVLLTSNFEGNISLLEFLEENTLTAGQEYNCSTSNCLDDYTTQGEITSLPITNGGEGEIAGFSIMGSDVSSVNSVKLTLSSNSPPACFFPQLFIDVLNDGQKFIVNNQGSGQICSPIYGGCFNENDAEGSIVVSQNAKYCELITLPAAPSFELGAKIKNSTQGVDTLKMLLYKSDDLGDFVADCILPEHTDSTPGVYEEIKCNANYASALQDEYFVCVTSPGNSNYEIKFETENSCGTNSINNFGDPIADYDISAKVAEFGIINGLEISNSFSETYNIELAGHIYQDYISQVYDGNCNPSCIVPIRFFGQNQQLQFSNVEISYNAQPGTIILDKFYDLDLEPSTISSDELELDLEKAGFTIPLGSQAGKFKLYIDGDLVFQEDISIAESFEFGITPRFVAFGQNVLFKAISSENIINSTWDFGDGVQETVNGKEIRHRYLQEGEFDLEITLSRNDGASATKTFTIIVGDARTLSNQTIIDYRSRLSDLVHDIDVFPQWVKEAINNEVNLLALGNSLDRIEADYSNSSSDEDFQNVMLSLIDLKVPSKINISNSGSSLPLLIGFENIDISYIEEIGGGSGSDEESVRNAISSWMNQKLNPRISFEQVGAFYDDETEIILSKFVIETNPREDIQDVSYLIMGNDVESDGKFKTNYGQNSISGGTYITLETGSANKIFEFFVLGEFSPEELGTYISPEISRLGDIGGIFSPCNFNNICEENEGENSENCPADCGKGRWGWFFLLILLLLFFALVVYIALQEWYKRHYEKSLFKKENELYNLINFIYNARKSGLTNVEIRKKLKRVKWKGEQINYAFRKIDGKRTGMYEIPVFKFLENKKVKKELSRRHRGPVDPRHIRRRI